MNRFTIFVIIYDFEQRVIDSTFQSLRLVVKRLIYNLAKLGNFNQAEINQNIITLEVSIMAASKAAEADLWFETITVASEARSLVSWSPSGRDRQQVASNKKGAISSSSNPSRPHHTRMLDHTAHAKQRQAQRNLSDADINYVLLNGQIFNRAGAVIVHLRAKDVPPTDRANERYQQLIGTTVVLNTDGPRQVLTAYRNRQSGLRHIKRKPVYDRRQAK